MCWSEIAEELALMPKQSDEGYKKQIAQLESRKSVLQSKLKDSEEKISSLQQLLLFKGLV